MPNAEERRSERARVILTAMVENGSSRIPVRVSNLSAHGVLVIGEGLPESTTRIVFRCNEVATGGWIAWVKDGHAGIEFDDPIEPEKLVHKVAVPQTMIIKDTRKVDFRRPGFRGDQLTDEERRIIEEWNRSEPRPPRNEDH